MIEIIYCASGNKRFAEIAINAGFLYGAQLPSTIYFDPYFVDQDWKAPNKEKYIAAIAQYQPYMASVLDWEKAEQLAEVMEWAEEVARFVQVVMIIPKVHGGIELLPKTISGKPVRLGYSVPTKFGGTPLNYSEFSDWPVHLLGGSPKKQAALTKYLNVVSADGNMHQKMAVKYCAFFSLKKLPGVRNHPWPTLQEANNGKPWGNGSIQADAPYEAFRRSCENIQLMWQRVLSPEQSVFFAR